MSAVAKPVYVGAAGLTERDDGTYAIEELWSVTGCTAGTEIGIHKEAIDAARAASPPVPSMLMGLGIRLTQATARTATDHHVIVTLSWGVNDSPVLDDPWLYESSSDSVREVRGLDVNNDPIAIEYVNPLMLKKAEGGSMTKSEFLGIAGNMRRFQRGVTVPGFYNRVHVQCRRQISEGAAGGMSVHPTRWPAKYVDYVNYEIPKGGGGTVLVPAGVFRCASIRVYSRNRGVSFFVDAEFILDRLGHESIVLFTDTDGLVPSGLTDSISANMKKPWPPSAGDRYATADSDGAPPGGACRPQMLKGRATFSNPPFSCNLEPFYAT